MAILLNFRKTREDERRVEYLFGSREMDRRLVIDKVSLEGSPAEGTADRDYAAVLAKILRLQRERASWPEGGVYAA
jgi:hypothetical protein